MEANNLNLNLAENLTLPLDAVTETFAILAKRGMGKTYTASVLVEEMLKAGQCVVVADPVGVWWGLRSSADGSGPGLPIVVLGGSHGDLPLEASSGALLAGIVVEQRLSVVLDLSHFSKGDSQRFMTAFCETLYQSNREPLHLVLDEADSFAPQRPMPGTQRLLGAVDDLVRRGRARGVGVTMITQRPAVLNKDVLTQIEVLVALRMVSPQDQAAIDAWVRSHGSEEQRAELMESLSSLPVGNAWVWSPGWLDVFRRVQIRRRETFDSSSTPKVGERAVTPSALAVVDLDTLRQQLEAESGAEKSDGPAVLRTKIAELEAKLMEQAAQIVEVPVYILRDGEAQILLDAANNLDGMAKDLMAQAAEIRAALTSVPMPSPSPHEDSNAPEPETPAAVPNSGLAPARKDLPKAGQRRPLRFRPAPARREDLPPESLSLAAGALSRPQQAILDMLGLWHNLGVREPSRLQIAAFRGVKHNTSSFRGDMAELERRGLVRLPSRESVLLTTSGHLVANNVPVPTLGAFRRLMMERITSPQQQIMQILLDAYPASVSRQEIARRRGVKHDTSSFRGDLSKLDDLQFVRLSGRSDVTATALWFPKGLK